MKKSSKKILISCLATLPVIPTVALLTSCKSHENITTPNAQWSARFERVKIFTGVTDAKDLKTKMLNDEIINGKSILEKVCIALNISIQPNWKVKLVNNEIKEINNNLYFSIVSGRNLEDNNSLATEEFTCSITNLDSLSNTIFDNKLQQNDVANPEEYQNQFTDIISVQPTQLKQENIAAPNIQIGTTKISADSQVIKNYVSNLQTNYKIQDNQNTKSNLKLDLEYLVQDLFLKNLTDWKVPYSFLKNFNPFGSVTIQNKARNEVSANICIQLQNAFSSPKTFKFLNSEVSISPSETLTINILFNSINNANILTIDGNGNICLNLENFSVKYQKGKGQIETLNNQSFKGFKSQSLNITLTNVGSTNNAFNPKTQEEIDKVFSANQDKLTEDKIKEEIINGINKEFEVNKQKMLLNLDVVEAYVLPLIKTESELRQYDIDKNGTYALLDMLGNATPSFEKIIRMAGMDDAANVVGALFCGKPLYYSFRKIFPTLMKILRGLKPTIVHDIVDFLENSLMVNGKLKTEQQFRDFFANIGNLKSVVKLMIVGKIPAYKLELILQLIDTLAYDVDHASIWHWLCRNLNFVLDLLNIMGINLPAAANKVIDIVKELLNMDIEYDGKKVNFIFDIPLYNFLSREGVTIAQPLSILKKYTPILETGALAGINLLLKNKFNFNLDDIQNSNMMGTTLIVILKQILHFLAKWDVSKFNKNIWETAFKSFFVPKEINGKENETNKTIKELFAEDLESYKVVNPTWSAISKLESEGNYKKLDFELKLPTFSYLSYQNTLGTPTKPVKKISNVKYTYFFNDSWINSTINKNDQGNNVSYKKPYFYTTKGSEYLFSLKNQSFENKYVNANERLSNNKYFDNYNNDIYDENSIISLVKENAQLSFTFAKNEFIEIPGVGGVGNKYYFLTNEAYNKFLEQISENSNLLNLNTLTLKPNVYINFSKKVYTCYLKFPVKIGIKEWDATNAKEVLKFTDNISFPVTYQAK